MPKPTILLVGGAWHTADYLVPLATTLEAADHPTVMLSLPSVGASPPKSDFADDVALIRSRVTQLISEGERVLAVLHSYGGIVGTEALQGFTKASNEGTGALLGLLYIATMLPQKGDSFEAHLESVGDFAWKPAREALTVVSLSFFQEIIVAIRQPERRAYSFSFPVGWGYVFAPRLCGGHVLQRSGARAIESMDSPVKSTVGRVCLLSRSEHLSEGSSY